MEVRLNTHGEGKLSTKTYFANEPGFRVASVIVMGEKEAALLDTQWTRSNAHRVIAEILETGKKLTKIFVSHSHPDHYFGLGHIADEFPEAEVLALQEDCDMINEQFFGKIEHWENVIGKMNVCRKTVKIEPLKENYFELEGHRLEVIPKLMGDMRYNSVVWIPSIKTLYGSDLLFNEAHPFTCELTKEERQQWIKDLDFLKTLEPEVVIPGHQKPGMPFDYSSIDYTRKYVELTEKALEETDSAAEFFYAMFVHFPNSVLLNLSNEMNANVFKGGRDWNWREM